MSGQAGMDDLFRQMLREELSAGIGEELRSLRSEIAELKAGPPAELRGMLSLEQLAAYLGVRSEQTARAWCCRQGIRLRKVGSATRVLGSDVHAALSKK